MLHDMNLAWELLLGRADTFLHVPFNNRQRQMLRMDLDASLCALKGDPNAAMTHDFSVLARRHADETDEIAAEMRAALADPSTTRASWTLLINKLNAQPISPR